MSIRILLCTIDFPRNLLLVCVMVDGVIYEYVGKDRKFPPFLQKEMQKNHGLHSNETRDCDL